MKQVRFLLLLCCLSLAVVGCDTFPYHRKLVLFSGSGPIYDIGTCTNLTSNVTLYLTRPDGTVLGIDGGDGKYSVESTGDVASVEFTADSEGYRRIEVKPLAIGVGNVFVKDGSGKSVSLRVEVREHLSIGMTVSKIYYYSVNPPEDELWTRIRNMLSETATMKQGGHYELIPDNQESGELYTGGKLRVYASEAAPGFDEGTYETVEAEDGNGLSFKYGDEEHLFMLNPDIGQDTKMSGYARVYACEDVTVSVKEQLPDGWSIFRMEQWSEAPYFRDTVIR